MIGAMDAVLFLRVFALYKKSKAIYGLFIPILIQFASACIAVIPASLKSNSFNVQCDLIDVPIIPFTVMNVAVVFTHGMLFGTAYAKRKVSEAQSTKPVIKMVVHEGACIFAFFVGTIASMTPVSFVTRTCNPFILFVWPASIFSMICCKIVLNMRSLQVQNASNTIPGGTTQEKSALDLTVIRTSLEDYSYQEEFWFE